MITWSGLSQYGTQKGSHTLDMVYKGYREVSILVAPLSPPKIPKLWPQGGPYFKTCVSDNVMGI